ncbi:pathogen-associated molecular patterns-induced protein A70-like [Lotus japonicus]|uniref:pathogen-associated molecular patterns-induced protein A70-like n=1 Tax=Lotus japonicus TaxID=34305 RepID=UPI00258867A3|nr:pathogen-associated molecular patterns-induced protein A70-like [Lotus japonicus]
MADPATLIASWITPSSLFILVNLVIGTIAITSRLTAQKTQNDQPQLHRSPSLLDRVRSFNLRHYEPSQPENESESAQPQLVRTPSLLLERVTSFKFSLFQTQPALAVAETEHVQPEPENSRPDPVVSTRVRPPSVLERVRSMSFSRLYRSESMHREGVDPGPDTGHVDMKKSASERVVSGTCERKEEEVAVERRRPATAIGKGETTSWGEDEEVDARADDFINRFKKQLKLQRMDSILRYREMLRGN